MKKVLIALAMVAFVVTPAMAHDGALSALGLSGMDVVSDAEGMQVRGMASTATVAGVSVVNGTLAIPPFFSLSFNDTNNATAFASHAGPLTSQAVQAQNSAGIANVTVSGLLNLSITYSAAAGGSSSASAQ